MKILRVLLIFSSYMTGAGIFVAYIPSETLLAKAVLLAAFNFIGMLFCWPPIEQCIGEKESSLKEKQNIFVSSTEILGQKLNQLETNIARLNNNITNTQIVINNAVDSSMRNLLEEIIWMLDQVGDIKEAKTLLKDYEKSADMIKNIRKQAANNIISQTKNKPNNQKQSAQSNGIPINISNVTIPRGRGNRRRPCAESRGNIFSRMFGKARNT